jgi:hypothetical protein
MKGMHPGFTIRRGRIGDFGDDSLQMIGIEEKSKECTLS